VSGSANFMSRATAIFVMIFFATSLTLAYMASHKEGGGSVIKANAAKVLPANPNSNATSEAPADTKAIPK